MHDQSHAVPLQIVRCRLIRYGSSLVCCLLHIRWGPAEPARRSTVECDTEDALRALMVTTCLMGPFYNILKTQRNWLSRQGVPAADASYFIGRTYLGLAQDAEAKCTQKRIITITSSMRTLREA